MAIDKSISKSCSIYAYWGQFIIYNNYHTFAVHYPGFKELWDVEDNAEEEDRDEVEADSLADRAGLCDVPVGVGMADSAVPLKSDGHGDKDGTTNCQK